MSRPTVLTILAGSAVVAIAVGASASAQGPAGRTLEFRELERGSTFKHVRSTPGAPRQGMALGDTITFTNRLARGGKAVGRFHADCVASVGSRDFRKGTMTCAAVAVLTDGTLTFQANVSPGAPAVTGAVTGGTGSYAGARGTLSSRGSLQTVTLLP